MANKLTTGQELDSSYQKKRGIFLVGWLVFMLLSNCWLLYGWAAIYWDAVNHQDPAISRLAGPLAVGAISSLAYITGLLALWSWKKWGLYLIIITAALPFLINAFTTFSISINWFGILGLIVLWLIVALRWEDFTSVRLPGIFFFKHS